LNTQEEDGKQTNKQTNQVLTQKKAGTQYTKWWRAECAAWPLPALETR
jgi:hypothetical protein